MSRVRCHCTTGDIPHPPEIAHKRIHSRCTRTATMSVRRVRDTGGRKIRERGGWYHYCEPCGKAIVAYQGSDVESRSHV
jgi:hypothetical protein